MAEEPRRRARHDGVLAVLAAAAIGCLYLFFAGRSTLWDRDEPRFARATVEMVESGNYLYTTFNGRLRPDKPILVYWLMALAVRVLGPTELAFRFFSALGTVATCLLTWHMGRKLFGPKAALWAMLMLAATPMMFVLGTLATADAIMLPLVTAGLACFVASLGKGGRALPLAQLAAFTGLAMLAKGPLGGVPLIVIATAVAIGRRSIGLGGRYLLGCILATMVGAAIFCAWFVPANQATGGELLRLGVGHHVVGRVWRPLERHGGDFLLYLPYYVPVVLAGFFPWVLYLPGAISAMLGGRLGGRRGRAVLLAMILPVPVIMTFVATKLPHYVLPIWPGLALAVAATIEAAQAGTLTQRDRRWLGRGVRLLGIGAVVVGTGAVIASWLAPLPALRVGGTVVGAMLVVMTLLAMWAHGTRGPQAGALVLLVGMVLLGPAVHLLITPAVERTKIVPAIARRITAAAPPQTPVATYGFDEPSLNLYVGRPIRSFWREHAAPAQVLAWLREPHDGVLVLTGRTLRALTAGRGGIQADVLAAGAGVNYTKMEWLYLVVLRRRAAGPTSRPR